MPLDKLNEFDDRKVLYVQVPEFGFVRTFSFVFRVCFANLVLWFFVYVTFICISYKLVISVFWVLLSVLDFDPTVFLVRLGHSHSSCKFLRLFLFAVFLHSSCSVVASYFMLICLFVICCSHSSVLRVTDSKCRESLD